MSKSKWVRAEIKDEAISLAEKERDRIEGLQRAFQHMGKRKGKLPDFDKMALRIEPIIEQLQLQHEMERLVEWEAELKK